ncbi:hypothetical protein AB0C52_33320 [Streptomyces sp. NPDC048717]|uniref:hypothetical protein n=1 Tax=Streptomyces sp. NPDC048717 TaxID=3154928 RepID=UPI003448241B
MIPQDPLQPHAGTPARPPGRMDVPVLGNVVLHAHSHVRPQHAGGPGPAPGGPLPQETLGCGRQDEVPLTTGGAEPRDLLEKA